MKFHKPMLAKNYEGNEHRVVFPCYVQPKLDGIRCITDGERFWSRNGKLFPAINVRHLKVDGLATLMDGELMVDDSEHFEDVVSAVKNGSTLDRTLAETLHFHVFDVITRGTFRDRRMHMHDIVDAAERLRIQWRRVGTIKVHSEKELHAQAKRFLRYGFEGTMIRNMFGLYVPKRTTDLLKWKPLRDAEFEILDVREAKGKDAGTPIFICACSGDTDATFRVRPMGSTVYRRRLWRNRVNLIGQMITVEYQNLTKHGKPRFPRAKVIRDYE